MLNKNISSKILTVIEYLEKELDYNYTILETGKRQVEAVAFYSKNNYNIISNFGPYKQVENSVCFKKTLNEKR